MAPSESPDASPPRTGPHTAATSTPAPEPAEDPNDVLPNAQMTPSRSSGQGGRNRASSLARSFVNSSPPYGMWQATGEVASKAPTLAEIKHGAFNAGGWTEEGQLERRGFTEHQIQHRRASRTSSWSSSKQALGISPVTSRDMNERKGSIPALKRQTTDATDGLPSTIPEGSVDDGGKNTASERAAHDQPTGSAVTAEPSRLSPASNRPQPNLNTAAVGPDETGIYPNGYQFPPKHTWSQSTLIGIKAFWKFFLTPFGFLVTIYGLNIVAWGAMLFFVLLQAAPAMCHPSCNDPNSARQIWIEIDSQILNALFCVTGFGLIPWRFRDFYYLIQWRVFGKYDYFRRLAGHNRSWFRLPGSDQLNVMLAPPPVYSKKNPRPLDSTLEWTEEDIAKLAENRAVPLPPTSMPLVPLTGVRALPTRPFFIDIVVWMYVINTALQACLAGVMWGLNRFTRPSWVTGLLIGLACLVGIVAGIVVFKQGKKVKTIEGIPVVMEEIEVEIDAEKAPQGSQSENTGKSRTGEATQAEPVGPMTSIDTEGEEKLQGLRRTETKSMKTKGGQWFERH